MKLISYAAGIYLFVVYLKLFFSNLDYIPSNERVIFEL
jgi:hypothetical protein